MANAPIILKKDPNIPSYLDFKTLREEGIRHIASLSGDLWTDHNMHDPGITILEVLCYALMDLGYRTNLKTVDLLALKRNEGQQEDNFFTPAEILTSNPLTILDYRKLLIDIEGVRNAWLEVADEQEVSVYLNCEQNQLQFDRINDKELFFNGLYKIYLELDPVRPQDASVQPCGETALAVDRILTEAKNKLQAHRNLCEDFLEVLILRDEELAFCMDIEIKADADPEEILALIFSEIQRFLSPSIRFYTLQELLEKGKSIDEIFEGRPFSTESHGFIDTDELKKLERIREIHVSDLYQVIMGIDQVVAIKRLSVKSYTAGSPPEKWCLKLKENHRPVFSIKQSQIQFFKGSLPFTVDLNEASALFAERLSSSNSAHLPKENLDLAVPHGQYRDDLSIYHSIQHEFPLTYRIGEGELPEGTSKKRKAQAFQLKGYLLFYDQLLANYMQQIGHIRDLFSFTPDSHRNESLHKSYFAQPLHSVPGVEELIRYYQPDKGNGYAFEEVIATSTVYASSIAREQAIEGMITFAKEGIVPLANGNLYQIKVDKENKLYYFLISTPFGELQSSERFEKATEAEASAEAVIFLASLSQSYRRINNQQEEQFSFSLIYNPVNYVDFLNLIAENKDQYLKRRNKFLDHLLSRFGEHFTEYVLLMYALNGKKNDPEEIAEDKAAFLCNYPEISRNRGRGFNYTKREKTWNTDNISGLERRVTSLMGIHNWHRSSLCHFDFIIHKKFFYYLYKDYSGDVLFKSAEGYSSIEDAKNAFFQFLQLASDQENYKSIESPLPGYDCIGESKYGFFLYNEKKEKIAVHPRTYGSKALRDDKIDCISRLFANKGIIVKEEPNESGFYFSLLDENREQSLLKSAKSYPTENEAFRGWQALLEIAGHETNYINTAGAYGTGYSFGIYKKEEDKRKKAIAMHPDYYSTEEERDKKRDEVFQYLTGKQLSYTITQLPPVFSWSLYDQKGVKVLGSFYNFKTPEQTAAAWLLLKKTASDLQHYHDEEEENKFTFFIGVNPEVPLARSGAFSSQNEREKAKEMVHELISEGKILENVSHYPEEAYGYRLLDKDGKSVLISTTLYRTSAIARETGRKVLNAEGLASAGFIFEADLNNYYIGFKDKNEKLIILSAEAYQNSMAAEEALREVTELMERKPVSVHYYSVKEVFSYEIKDDKGAIKFLSYLLFTSWENAFVAFQNFLKAAVNEANFQILPQGLNNYVIAIFDEEKRKLAISPLFETRGEAENAVPDLIEFFKNYNSQLKIAKNSDKFIFQLNDVKNRPALISERTYPSKYKTEIAFDDFLILASHPENYQTVYAEDGCRYSFQVKGENGVIANHPDEYLTFEEKEKAQNELIAYIRKNKLYYEIKQQNKSFHFEILWIDCRDMCSVLLKGLEEHHKDGTATEEFHAFLGYFYQGDITLQPFEEEGKFSFQAMFKEKAGALPVAVHPKFYPTAEKRDDVLDDANKYLLYSKTNPPPFNWDEEFKPVLFEEEGKDRQVFRLLNKDEAVATHPATYNNEHERNKVLKDFIQQVKISTPFYTKVKESGDIVKEVNGGWYFLIRDQDTEQELWQSATAFNSKQEAEAQFKKDFIRIIGLASHLKNYDIPDSCAPGDVVNLREGENKIAFFIYQAEETSAIEKRMLHACLFPFRQIKDRYTFSIYSKTRKKNDWESTSFYSSFNEVKAAFKKFLALLNYEGNYQLKDHEAIRRFGFSLRKVYLEGIIREPTRDQKEDCEKLSSSLTTKLGNFLTDVQREGAYYPFVKDDVGCCYSFRIVDEHYRLAKHTRRYLTRQERENVRDSLFAIMRCHEFKVHQPEKGVCRKKDAFHYLLKEKSGKVLWRSFESWSKKETALMAYRLHYIQLLSYAREADFYKIIRNENGFFSINLQNAAGKVIADCPEVFPPTEEGIASLKSALYDRIIFSRLYPVVHEQDKLYLQIYLLELGEETLNFPLPVKDSETTEQNQVTLNIPGSMAWESIKSYPATALGKENDEDLPADIASDIELLLDLLNTKENYQRVDKSDCGPFSLEITNPKHVLAIHPASYCTRKELEEEIQNTKALINTEGFHVVEHILLRPRNGIESRYHVSLEIGPNEGLLINRTPFDSIEEAEGFKDEFSNRLNDVFSAGNIRDFLREGKNFNPEKLRIKELEKLAKKIITQISQKFKKEEIKLTINNTSEGQNRDLLMPICADCGEKDCFIKETTGFCQETQESQVSYIPGADPYSFWITVVLPYWPKRFQNTNFRTFFEKTLRREAPAHVALRIAWVDPLQMCAFEKKYRTWLDAVNNVANCHLQNSQNELIACLTQLKNVYPPAKLESSASGAFTFGHTKLG